MTAKRILTVWGSFVVLSFLLLQFPHHYIDPMAWVNTSLQALLLILSLYIIKNSNRRNRPVYVNFALLFFFTILSFNSTYVGKSVFSDFPYALVTYHTYVNKIGIGFVLTMCLGYLLVDYFFQKWSNVRKYLLTLTLSIVLFVPLFSMYIVEPLSLYKTEEYTKFMQIKSAHQAYLTQNGVVPTEEQLRLAISTTVSQQEVQALKSYLAEGAETILFWKPLNIRLVFVHLFLVALLVFFVVHKYKRDKPHSPYLEKIATLFIIWGVFNAFNHVSFLQVHSLDLYHTLFTLSQYLTILILLLLVYVFSMRLKFVLSATGKYYEEELLFHPERITRWRDEIDTLVLNHIFTPKNFFGRLMTIRKS